VHKLNIIKNVTDFSFYLNELFKEEVKFWTTFKVEKGAFQNIVKI